MAHADHKKRRPYIVQGRAGLHWIAQGQRWLGAVLLVMCASVAGGPKPAAAQDAATHDAAALEPPAPTPALAAVDSLRQAGAFREALGRLSTLQNRLSPGDSLADDVGWRLAVTRIDLGETSDSDRTRTSLYRQALKDAQAALAADSSSAYAHLALAVAQGRAALRADTRERVRRSRAVEHHANRAIALDSTLAPAYHVRGRWHREVADLGFFERTLVRAVYGGLPEASFAQAVRDFQQAIRLQDKVIHRLELGKTYLAMDKRQNARRALQAALKMEPIDPDGPRHQEEARRLLRDLG